MKLNTDRCMHGRYRIDPCIGCGRRYVDGQLTGPMLTAAPSASPSRHVPALLLLTVAMWGGAVLLVVYGGEPDSPLPGVFAWVGLISLVTALALYGRSRGAR